MTTHKQLLYHLLHPKKNDGNGPVAGVKPPQPPPPPPRTKTWTPPPPKEVLPKDDDAISRDLLSKDGAEKPVAKPTISTTHSIFSPANEPNMPKERSECKDDHKRILGSYFGDDYAKNQFYDEFFEDPEIIDFIDIQKVGEAMDDTKTEHPKEDLKFCKDLMQKIINTSKK